ncbi:MAG: hypothetical protein DHS20C17_24150 [Cyclobacteriaceae bacterium]|nr:MAG: hypothetical protein DHS20C17_24150 [Cyclobacteriaceae bacterium]
MTRRIKITDLWRLLTSEPLIPFVAIGAIVFLLYAWTLPDDPNRIEVNSSAMDFLAEERELVLGRQLSQNERQQLVANYIEEEILLREAYARGLDQQDASIRLRLVDKMRFMLTEEPVDPTEDTLHQFYLDHQQLYLEPARISFEHIFFSKALPPNEAENLLVNLSKGSKVSDLGEAFWLGSNLINYSKPDLTVILGSAFTDQVFHSEPQRWSGPYQSIKGQHFVKITELQAPKFRDFEEVKHFVKEDWGIYRRRFMLEQQLEQLKRKYQIVDLVGDKSI